MSGLGVQAKNVMSEKCVLSLGGKNTVEKQLGENKMKKYIKDGKIGVLYSPGYGAGWSTWGSKENKEAMVFCEELCEAVDKGLTLLQIKNIAHKCFPEEYLGGLDDIKLVFLKPGTRFRIDEYDGSESIITKDEYYEA